MKNIIFIAPPAAGKGTQSKLVSEEYNIPHISTGDLLRDEVASGSVFGKMLKAEMDQGGLISDDTMVNLLRNRIMQVDCNNGYILDGYPRNIEQARIYDNLVQELGKDIGTVIVMNIDEDLILNRSLNRLICQACGTSYNREVEDLKPKIDGFCDKCGYTLEVRSDDTKETLMQRIKTYEIQTKPLIEYYKEKNIVKEINIEKEDSATDIFNKIKSIID